jgi:predicted metal-dependent phosphoesterase TrpH
MSQGNYRAGTTDGEGAVVRIDLHVHSEDSYDGHESVELVLKHASTIELDGVVITDHDEIGESKRAAELAPEYGLVGIPGVEVSTAVGHLLAIGVEERPGTGRRSTRLSGTAVLARAGSVGSRVR